MAEARTVVGLRRLRILRSLAGARSPMTAVLLASRLGLSSRTVRDHLDVLLGLGCVSRFNYRRWQLADGFSLKGFDCSKLDGGSNANPRP